MIIIACTLAKASSCHIKLPKSVFWNVPDDAAKKASEVEPNWPLILSRKL